MITNAPNRILVNALTEFGILRRLTRFWLLAVFLTLISQVGYILACWYLSYHLPYDPTAGINAPKYLLGNIDPTIFLLFQWASLFLLFDVAHRHTRNRIDEVMATIPLSNLEIFAGRVLAVSCMVWIVASLNILIMQLMGSFSFFGWNHVETIQWHSVVNLILIDGPVNLIFWTSFLVLFGVFFKSRVLVLLVGGTAMFSWYWLVIRSPYSVMTLVSPSSNDSILISELVPDFLSLDLMSLRISYVFIGGVFLLSAALLWNRKDSLKYFKLNLGLLPLCIVCGLVTYFFGAWGILGPFKEFDRWKQVHAEFEWLDDIDIQRISGNIQIDPYKQLDTEFIIGLVRNSGSTTQPFIFTLNPGMKIHSVEVDGTQVDHDFNEGLLKIPNVNVEIGIPFKLAVKAQGKPDPKFAYLDSVVNYLTDSDVPVHAAKLFGKHGSIFKPSYVALMPGAYWYPTPGPVNENSVYTQHRKDFFIVDLTVTLKPKDWSLVASATVAEDPDTSNTYVIRSSSPVSEIGLFTSQFKHETIEVGGISFSMYLSSKHKENLHPIPNWNSKLHELAESWIKEYQNVELLRLVPEINFVEVPRSLRTVGGGWRMDAVDSLPGGLILLKEHGYPRANLQLARDRYVKRVDAWGMDPEEKDQLLGKVPLEMLALYFNRGKGTDAPWTSLNKHLWTNHMSPADERAIFLDQVVNWLLASPPSEINWGDRSRQFSIYSTLRVSDFTMFQLIAARRGLTDVLNNPNIVHPRYESDAVRIERTFIERSSIWNHLEKSVSVQPGSQGELEALLLKSREIAEVLLEVNGQEALYQWITEFRKQHVAQPFSYLDLINSAKQHEIEYTPFLTDWTARNTIPAFLVHEPKIRQIANDERGDPQYQTTLVLENTQPVMGYVELRVPTEETAHSPFSDYVTVDSIPVEANSVHRANLVTAYRIHGLRINPGLSFNRENIFVELIEQPTAQNPIPSSSPTEEAVNSRSANHSITVDDLDEGFVVRQRIPNLGHSPRFGPLAWFSVKYADIELDKKLPIQPRVGLTRSISNFWQRQTEHLFVVPFGRYRQTYAYIEAEKEIPTAEFEAKIPSDGEWQLDYHYPWIAPTEWRRESEIPVDDTLSLEISQSGSTIRTPLDIKSMSFGWNTVGRFDLNNDSVSVKIVYQPKPAAVPVTIYADAIRWTPIE